jgi:hypothetical protein
MLKYVNQEKPLRHFLKQKIVPERYIWHITKKNKLKDYSIAKEGIVAPNYYGVFANNQMISLHEFFPICMDIYDWWEKIYLPSYSFWRIDTHKLNFEWYIDPFMKDDLEWFISVTKTDYVCENFICTPNSIPNYAIELFEFDKKTIELLFRINEKMLKSKDFKIHILKSNSLMNYLIYKLNKFAA